MPRNGFPDFFRPDGGRALKSVVEVPSSVGMKSTKEDMVGGLEKDELRVLLLLESGAGVPEGLGEQGVNVSRRLFEFGLVRRGQVGALALTRAGERLLFRLSCASFLRGDGKPTGSGVRQWLEQNGFIKLSKDGKTLAEVTPRGQLWLASLDDKEVRSA
jgi:hypothetical protein